MPDSCELQKILTDILTDLRYMSVDVIKKTDIYLETVKILDLPNVEPVSQNIKTLFERININLIEFRALFDVALKNFKESQEAEQVKSVISPTPKTKLSLRKNGDIIQTDVDLTQSDSEEPKQETSKSELPNKVTTPAEKDGSNSDHEKPAIVVNGSIEPSKSELANDTTTTTDKGGLGVEELSDDGSDSDHEEPILRNFDVPLVVNGSIEAAEDLKRALDELSKEEVVKNENNIECASFDFDETDDLLVQEMEKLDTSNDFLVQEKEKLEMSNDFLVQEKEKLEMSNENTEDALPSAKDDEQKENHELLALLNKATSRMNELDAPATQEDVNDALQLLEDDDMSVSTSLDSDDSFSFDDSDDEMRPVKPGPDGYETESKDSSDNESLAEDPLDKCKNFQLELKRVDNMSDAEIDRLCDIHSINKRKCKSTLKRSKRKRFKKLKILSTSSSSLSSLDDSTSECVTPDLDINDLVSTSFDNNTSDAVAALADECADMLDKEDDEISLDSTDVDEEPEKKKNEAKKENTIKKENDDDKKDEKEIEDQTKKKKDWKKDFLLNALSDSDSDSDDSSVNLVEMKTIENGNNEKDMDNDSESDVILMDDKENINEVDDDDDKTGVLKKIDCETMVITDSSDSDSDEVTIIDDSFRSDGSGRGRRNIRAIIDDEDLNELTQKAKSEEDERIMRLEERSKTIERIQSQHEDFVLDVDVKTGSPLITVDRHLAKMLKPHQKSGVEFMWQACYETVDILKKKPGTGCILAHCMGLGKTLQVITLIHTLFTHPVTNTKHVLVVCPLSTVINWKTEFRKAFRQFDIPPNISRYTIVKGDISERLNIVHKWRETGGVLILGYEAFQIICNERVASRICPQQHQRAIHALVDPGPDLIVCDEGHQLKNGKTLKTQALMKVKTKRRIVLTGTPLQNNLKEYYFMVQFVKPHLLGTYTEYTNRFSTPIMNGQYHDSRPEDIKIMKKTTHVLTKLLKKTIHRVEGSVLSTYLPEITDYTIFIKLTPLQVALYTKYIDMVTSHTENLSAIFFHDTRITNFCNFHPYALDLYYSKPKQKKKKKVLGEHNPNEEEWEDTNVNHVRDDWYKDLLPQDVSVNINYSSKLKLAVDIINETVRHKEKVLVFVQYLVELDILEHFLKQGTNKLNPNVDYYRMDGQTSVENRDIMCKNFNTNPTAKVFLLTHKVGGLGLNLTGANRVILIGSNHNPSHDTQSLYRVYRFGQQKKCYVYRLLSIGTMEEKIYHRCVLKLSLSGTVVDKLHFDRIYKANDLREMYKYDFSKYDDRPIPTVPTDVLLATLLQNCPDIYSYHLHNALLENRPDEELTDEDKKLAWEEWNMEEAAKHLAVAPPIAPPRNPLMQAEFFTPKPIAPPRNPLMRVDIVPANPYYPYNRFRQFCGPRANAPNLVPNPMVNNNRGLFPRLMTPNRPIPSTSGQRFSNQNNQFGNMPQSSSRQPAPSTVPPKTKNLPAILRLHNFARALHERNKAPAPPPPPPPKPQPPLTGEFNYALNKIV